MLILRIEHPVPDFAAWKKAFDSDPLGRRLSGVRRHRILRSSDDQRYVTVDLEFDNPSEVESFHAALQKLWGRVQGQIIDRPRARVLEVVENTSY